MRFRVDWAPDGPNVASEERATVADLRVFIADGNACECEELFTLGRAIGDAVANPEVERSAVNDLHEAARQATGRAFAAEFLAPIDEIRSMQEDGKTLSTIV